MKKETLFLCLIWATFFAAPTFARTPEPICSSPSLHRVPEPICASPPNQRLAVHRPVSMHPRPASIHYKIIAAAGHSFGYDVYSNGKILVHQVSIPGMPGHQGFKRRKDAEKVAALVVKKLEKKRMPPTVTRAELDELKIKY